MEDTYVCIRLAFPSSATALQCRSRTKMWQHHKLSLSPHAKWSSRGSQFLVLCIILLTNVQRKVSAEAGISIPVWEIILQGSSSAWIWTLTASVVIILNPGKGTGCYRAVLEAAVCPGHWVASLSPSLIGTTNDKFRLCGCLWALIRK